METILLFLLTAFTAGAVQFVPVNNSSSVFIRGYGKYGEGQDGGALTRLDSSYSGHEAASGMAFNASLSDQIVFGPISDTALFARSTASLDTGLEDGRLSVVGGVYSFAGAGAWWAKNKDPGSFAESISMFDLVFQVATETVYHMAGWATAYVGSSSSVVLAMMDGTLLENQTGPGNFDLTGTLLPGTYRLTAEASSVFTGTYYDARSGYAGFDFAADFTETEGQATVVPEGGSLFLALVFGFVVLVMLRRNAEI